jgi:hypothetical protein
MKKQAGRTENEDGNGSSALFSQKRISCYIVITERYDDYGVIRMAQFLCRQTDTSCRQGDNPYIRQYLMFPGRPVADVRGACFACFLMLRGFRAPAFFREA